MISGLQKMTLLDFPGKVACTVFLQGCNYRCPFCHNTDLLPGRGEEVMSEEAFISFLKKRQGLLDGVCVSGGEPTLYPGLLELLGRIKALGFAVKLDTNGSRPEIFKEVVQKGLVDYVAMDVKNSPTRYAETVGVSRLDLGPTEESLRFLISGNVDYELRTTVVKPLHDIASAQDMGVWLGSLVPGKRPKRLFLQKFVDRESVLFSGLSAALPEEMQQLSKLLAPFCEQVSIRGE